MNNTGQQLVHRKLFNIHYNNKVFTIFIDQYGRRTFLEIDSSGNYIYPLIDDFIELHKIYNERDIFTSHGYNIGEHIPIHRDKRIAFKEGARLVTGQVAEILAAVMIANVITGTTMSTMFKLKQDGTNIRIVVDYVDGTLITNTNELDSALGYKSVSTEEVINTINANDNIDQYYKKYAIDLVNYIKNKYPDTDARIFYENMKTVSIIEKNLKSMKRYAGTYSSLENIISIREDYTESREVITHEFAHAYHHWKENTLMFPKYRTDPLGHSLDEAMTNKIIDGIAHTHTYKQEGRVLDYFLNCVDYDYYDYEREGIAKLISLLKEKYPNVDIEYIINAVDAMNDTYFSTGENIKLEDNPQVLDEIFMLCIHNIDLNSNSHYQPFIDFLKSIDYDYSREIAQYYLNEYNSILVDKGYDPNRIEEDIAPFIVEQDSSKMIAERLREYISKLDISSLPKNNLYQPFKEFLESATWQHTYYYISDEETKKVMCNLLDIYNDSLYCNGYTRSETITSEMVLNKTEKFKGIKVLGYAITNDDIIYPTIEIENKDKIYNSATRVAVLDEEGKIVLIDRNNIKAQGNSDTDYYQYKFVSSLFTNLDQESFQFDQEYWQDIFNLKEYKYKKIPLYLDGTKLSEDYIKEVYVSIGQEDDGTNTFAVVKIDQLAQESSAQESSLIELLKRNSYDYLNRMDTLDPEESKQLSQYLNDYYLKTKTALIPLVKYIDGYLQSADNITSIDLNQFLNEEYLKEQIAGSDLSSTITPRYDNFTYDAESDIVKVHPTYHVTMDEDDRKLDMNAIRLYLEPNETSILIGDDYKNVERFVKDDGETSTMIYLETVLDYYGILQEDKQDYHFSEPEILELYNNYSHDVYINKDNTVTVTNNRISSR